MKQLDEMSVVELGRLHAEIESRLVQASMEYVSPTELELREFRKYPNSTTLAYAKRIFDTAGTDLVWLVPMARCRLAHETHR